jgi:hypothetical protein
MNNHSSLLPGTALHCTPYMLTKCIQATAGNSLSIQLDHPITSFSSFSSRHPTSQSEKSQAWDWMDVSFVRRQPMAMHMAADTKKFGSLAAHQ